MHFRGERSVSSTLNYIHNRMKKILLSMLMLAVSLAGHAGPKVGLVLSGGGAKGVAHIGVIKALEDNDIPIDYVAGTSMGAIIAGLYASGYSPEEMLDLVTSKDFLLWSQGEIDPSLSYYFTTPRQSPSMVNLPIGSDSIAKSVPQSIIGPNAMNFPFMRIFMAQTAASRGDFDKLFVPLRTVSSNIKAQRGEVAREGDLTTAIRASMSIPIVYCPVEINDTLHYDGGIFDNFPVDVMRSEFHPDFMIGSDVHTPSAHPVPNVVNQVEGLAMRPQSYGLPDAEGVKVHIDLSDYSMLDFAAGHEIYAKGYAKGMEMVDSIKGRTGARIPHAEVHRRRAEYVGSLPEVKFSSVKCTGGSDAQNRYIASQFRPSHKGDALSMDDAKWGYYRAISSGQIADLKIRGSQRPDGNLELTLKAYPRSPWSLDLGTYLTTSSTNMLYGAVNYRILEARSLNASVRGWVGWDYLAAEVLGSIRFGGENPYSLGLQGVVSRHYINRGDKFFFQGEDTDRVKSFEAFGRLDLLRVALGPHGEALLQAGYGYKSDECHLPEGDRLKISHTLAQLVLRYDYNTLDAVNYPLEGLGIHSSLMGLLGRSHDHWVQLDAEVTKYWPLHKKFSFGVYGHLLASGRKAPADEYEAVIEAPEYMPVPSCFNALNPSLRAYSFLGIGANPVWIPLSGLQLRGSFNIFVPWERIGSDKKVDLCEFLGQVAAVYHIKKISVSAYCDYRTGTHRERGFHAGLAIGVLMPAPTFLR